MVIEIVFCIVTHEREISFSNEKKNVGQEQDLILLIRNWDVNAFNLST